MARHSGMTLIELMITITVAAILLTIAVPSMQTLMSQSRVSSNIDEIYRELSYARQMAATYQSPVTLCPLDNNNECVNDWSKGFSIFIDTGATGVLENDDELMKIHAAISQRDFLVFEQKWVRFTADGMTQDEGTFTYCPGDKASELSRSLAIAVTGLARYLSTAGNCQ